MTTVLYCRTAMPQTTMPMESFSILAWPMLLAQHVVDLTLVNIITWLIRMTERWK